MKLKMVTGISTIASGGTAQALTSTGYKAVLLHVECMGDQGIMLGDSSVVYSLTAGTGRGILVCDTANTATSATIFTLTAPGALDMGGRFSDATPYFDLSEIYVDGTTGHDCTWTALVIVG